jgi:hypothetical protein
MQLLVLAGLDVADALADVGDVVGDALEVAVKNYC